MKADEFVQVVAGACPGDEEMRAHGLQPNEIADIRATFTFPPTGSGVRSGRGEVFDLLESYDCSRIEISHVRLLGRPEPHAQGTLVAMWESDPIVVTAHAAVEVFDHELPGRRLCVCALDQGAFLEALAVLVRAIGGRAHRAGKAREVTAACSRAAGTDDARAFFGPLCSFLDR